MNRRSFMIGLAAGSALASRQRSIAAEPLPPKDHRSMKENLAVFLEPIRKKHQIPSLAAAVVLEGKIIASGVCGVRKADAEIAVSLDDKFHIGSCTKSMTATLAAQFVEEKKIKWHTKIASVFPDLAPRMKVAYRSVTLEQLLSHRAGVPHQLDRDNLWGRIGRHRGSPVEQRKFLMQEVLSQPSEAAPGTKFIYSNAGYAIAGAMLEKLGGMPWEQSITEKLFKPLT